MRPYLFAFLLLTLTACSKPGGAAADDAPAAPVEVAKVERKSINATITAEALLYPLRQAVIVPKISAPVQRFLVNRGDHVRAGQLVAELESRDLAASAQESKQLYEQAQATFQNTSAATLPDDLTKAQTDTKTAQEGLDAARTVYESRVKLYREGALAQKLVEDAKVTLVQAQGALATAQKHLQALQNVGQSAQLRAGQAQVDAAQAHYQSSQAQYSYAQVHSPIAGVVSDRPLNIGEMASSGSALLTVVDISRVVARANVPVTEASRMRIGQAATIKSGEAVLNGKVTVVSPAVDPNTTTVQVWVEAPNPAETIKLGATVDIAINVGEVKDAIVVPAAALLNASEGGGERVMIAGADNLAHEQAVTVGIRNGDDAQILTGLKGDETVIVNGALGLDDKAKIQIGTGEKDDDKKAGDGKADDKKADDKAGKEKQ